MRLKVSSLVDHSGILWVDISSVVLLMRVHALWQKNKLLGIFLAVLAVVSIALGVALLSAQPGVSEFIGRSRYAPLHILQGAIKFVQLRERRGFLAPLSQVFNSSPPSSVLFDLLQTSPSQWCVFLRCSSNCGNSLFQNTSMHSS